MARKPTAKHGIPDTLADLAVPVADLVPFPGNARRGSVDAVAESLRANGQYRPIVVREGTGEVLAGNHTLRAAKSLGWTHVAATFMDVNDADAKRIVLVDNRTNDIAGYDDSELVALLESMDGDLSGTGFDDDDLSALLDSLAESTASDESDKIDRPQAMSHPGDVWGLGAHTLTVGDDADDDDLTTADLVVRYWSAVAGQDPIHNGKRHHVVIAQPHR